MTRVAYSLARLAQRCVLSYPFALVLLAAVLASAGCSRTANPLEQTALGGDKPSKKRLPDHQLQTALDYLHSWNVFAKQAAKKA